MPYTSSIDTPRNRPRYEMLEHDERLVSRWTRLRPGTSHVQHGMLAMLIRVKALRPMLALSCASELRDGRISPGPQDPGEFFDINNERYYNTLANPLHLLLDQTIQDPPNLRQPSSITSMRRILASDMAFFRESSNERSFL